MNKADKFTIHGAALLIVLLSGAVSCPQDANWFKQNKRGNRYEGLTDQANGLADYKVIDLIASTGVAPQSDTPRLHIAYFVPSGQRLGPFQVRERVDETQYLMIPIHSPDRPGKWNVFGDWETSDVIQPNHVRLANLGILIRLNNPGTEDALVPAVFYGDKVPTTIKGYELHVYIEPALRSLGCTVQTASGKLLPNTASSGCSMAPKPSPGLPSSSTVRFTIAAAGLTEGDVIVHLTGAYANDTKNSRFSHDLHFYHQPHLPEGSL